MTVLDLRNFMGEVPKVGPSALQPTQAQRATNCRLVSNEVRPYKAPLFVYQPANQPETIYRGTNGQQSQWYSWLGDVNVVESPIADVSDFRIYYTGDGVPKKTDWTLATTGVAPYPAQWLNMGVPNPVGAPTLTLGGSGSGTTVTRAYVYTYLSTFGSLVEESGPSPAQYINWQSGNTVTVNGFSSAPTTNYNITGINIYRTVTPASGIAQYQLVATITIGTSSYVDSILDANISNTVLPSLTWVPPPSNLTGLTNMGYGMLAGFVANQLYISVPYFPHAWPVQNILTFPANIIGLAMMGGTLVVCTDQYPWLISGTSPSNLTQQPVMIHEPCVSKRSIVSNLTGVLYASPNGMVGISELVQGVITDALIERDAWQNFNPDTMIGAVYDGRYVGAFTLPTGGDLIDGGATDLGGYVFLLDKADEPVRALYAHMDVASFAMAPPLTFMNFYARGLYLDRNTGFLYGINQKDYGIYQLDGDPINSMVTDWKSKRFQFPSPINFACIQADAEFQIPSLAAYNQYYNNIVNANTIIYNSGITQGMVGDAMFGSFMFDGSAMQPLPEPPDVLTCQVIVYADGNPVLTWTPVDNEPVRLPGGFRAQIWEVEVASNFPIRSVSMATSLKELRDLVMMQQQAPQGGGQ